jgi:DNA-binding NtrC family response regulator
VPRILVIEDEENLRFSMRQALIKGGHEVLEADSTDGAEALLAEHEFDAIVTDVNLRGGGSGTTLVEHARAGGFGGVIIVVTAFGSVQNAVAAIKLGADDYLQKPLVLEELVIQLDRMLEQRKVRARLQVYERLERVRGARPGIIGESAEWQRVVEMAERLSAIPVRGPQGTAGAATPGGALPTILLTGETGTGKGLLARHIHESGERGRELPFVHVNCSALPPSLVEAELFGHERGAFTDAKSSREGLFEIADGGTIFLDEIGDMPLDLQAKVLTIVEEGVFRRVGGSRDRTVRARIIAATNQDLERCVADGAFRRDLLYRLNAFTIVLPPLRRRGRDSVLLFETMLDRFCAEYGRPAPSLLPGTADALVAHAWPGNVRELINTAQRVAMLCDAPEIGEDALLLGAGVRPGEPSRDRVGDGLVFDFAAGPHTADEIERLLMIQALEHTHGNVSQAAKLIGMQRSSFRYRLDRFNLHEVVKELTP